MSANLDKSLDEIIATKPRGPRNARSRRTSGGRGSVSKTGTSTVKKAVAKKAPVAPAASKINIIDEASKLADRIIISNLPVDVTERAVKNYFSHEIGPVTSCQISYNSKGQSTGVVTITFKKTGDAHKATVRFNGTSIDNGAKFMKVELVMDPSKRPLASRLNPGPKNAPKQPARTRGGTATTKGGAKAGEAKAKPSKPRPARRPKKTLEELDAEMEDYFENKS